MPSNSPIEETLIRPAMGFRIVAGAAAGNVTVTGIKKGDILLFVGGFIIVEGTPNTLTIRNDLTSEFTVSAANTINNTGGTGSTPGLLLVIWLKSNTVRS